MSEVTTTPGGTAGASDASPSPEPGAAGLPTSQLYGRLAALPEALEPLGKPFYLVALLLIFVPALDFWSTISPTHWDEVRWRFGVFGILSGFFLTPLFGAVLAMALAAMMEHRRMQLLFAACNTLVGLGVLGAIVIFILDTVQIRGQLEPGSVGAFDAVFLRTGAKLLIGALTFLWLARAGVRSFRKTSLPEGWQPGDPVPIVNTDTTNLEGVLEAPALGERVSREMLISSDAFDTTGTTPAKGEALRPDMLMTPMSVPAIQPDPTARKSDGVRPDMLVSTDKVGPTGPPPVEPRRVTKEMLIVGSEEEPK